MFVLLLFVLGTQLAHGFCCNTGFVEYSFVNIPNTQVIPKNCLWLKVTCFAPSHFWCGENFSVPQDGHGQNVKIFEFNT